jgi:hypothetical protein
MKWTAWSTEHGPMAAWGECRRNPTIHSASGRRCSCGEINMLCANPSSTCSARSHQRIQKDRVRVGCFSLDVAKLNNISYNIAQIYFMQ